jgi:NMD protein affecting ribosome stability and mRNA decay
MASVKWCVECGKRFEPEHQEGYCPRCHREIHERIARTGTPLKPRKCQPRGPAVPTAHSPDHDVHVTSVVHSHTRRLSEGFRLLRAAGDHTGNGEAD